VLKKYTKQLLYCKRALKYVTGLNRLLSRSSFPGLWGCDIV